MQVINHTHSCAARNTPKQWPIHHKLPHHQSQTYIKNWDQNYAHFHKFFQHRIQELNKKTSIYFSQNFSAQNQYKNITKMLRSLYKFFREFSKTFKAWQGCDYQTIV
jgi:hypothetical protein